MNKRKFLNFPIIFLFFFASIGVLILVVGIHNISISNDISFGLKFKENFPFLSLGFMFTSIPSFVLYDVLTGNKKSCSNKDKIRLYFIGFIFFIFGSMIYAFLGLESGSFSIINMFKEYGGQVIIFIMFILIGIFLLIFNFLRDDSKIEYQRLMVDNMNNKKLEKIENFEKERIENLEKLSRDRMEIKEDEY